MVVLRLDYGGNCGRYCCHNEFLIIILIRGLLHRVGLLSLPPGDILLVFIRTSLFDFRCRWRFNSLFGFIGVDGCELQTDDGNAVRI